jgi:hypothetical protein
MNYTSKILEVSHIIFSLTFDKIDIESIDLIDDKDDCITTENFYIQNKDNKTIIIFNTPVKLKFIKIIRKDLPDYLPDINIQYYLNDKNIANLNRNLNTKITFLNFPQRNKG